MLDLADKARWDLGFDDGVVIFGPFAQIRVSSTTMAKMTPPNSDAKLLASASVAWQ
jgi:hypothetical protein